MKLCFSDSSFFLEIAAAPDAAPIRQITMDAAHVAPKAFNSERRRSRPRLNWCSVQHAKAIRMFHGSQDRLDDFFSARNLATVAAWHNAVKLESP